MCWGSLVAVEDLDLRVQSLLARHLVVEVEPGVVRPYLALLPQQQFLSAKPGLEVRLYFLRSWLVLVQHLVHFQEGLRENCHGRLSGSPESRRIGLQAG